MNTLCSLPLSDIKALWEKHLKQTENFDTVTFAKADFLGLKVPDLIAEIERLEYKLKFNVHMVCNLYESAVGKAIVGRDFPNPCEPGTIEYLAYEEGTAFGRKRFAERNQP